MLSGDRGANYKITSQTVNSERGPIKVWGILGYENSSLNHKIKRIHLDDISDDYTFTENLINVLKNNNVSLVHMQDIVEDFLITY